MDDLDGLRDTGQLQSALRGDFEIVASYGAEHPAAWAGAWWDNEPTVRIVAAFTGDAAQHDDALRPRLQHPGRLVVETRQHSLSDLRQVREEIARTLHQRQAQTGRQILSCQKQASGRRSPDEPFADHPHDQAMRGDRGVRRTLTSALSWARSVLA